MTLKNKKQKLAIDYDISIAYLTEVNKNWRLIEYTKTVWGATPQWT